MKGPMIIMFFERINTEENCFFLSLHQPPTSREYCLCILAMFTTSNKDLKRVNRPSLAVWRLCICKCETCMGIVVKLWFSDNIVIKLATYLTMRYI